MIGRKIKEIADKKLIGQEAHRLMIPSGRNLEFSKDEKYKKSAVNIILFDTLESTNLILMKRNSKLEYHSGQISLPGGSFDNNDKNLWETAKRETYEEIGIEIKDEHFIKELSPLYIPVSNFLVHPFVSYISELPPIKINKSEVEKIFFADIYKFFDDSNKYFYEDKNLKYPYYKVERERVWGATAMILTEFYLLLKDIL